ncbi:hypothetical protein [Streptomyces sp. HUAS ZL42]|uniref:hypothetical protein n=1 Tax=Streptomyces sp. HUAS ZL42 TaxID=3231715 RepID=UPI00345EC7D9
MSLTSEVVLSRDDGDIDILVGEKDGRPDGVDLAGPESWRTGVWGSQTIRRVGALHITGRLNGVEASAHYAQRLGGGLLMW